MASTTEITELISALSNIPGPVGWTAFAALGFWALRQVVLIGRNDLTEMKANAIVSDGMDMLQKRVHLMDTRIAKLESDRAKLMGFCTEVLLHFSGCSVCGKMAKDRDRLQAKYQHIMTEMSDVQ